MIMPIEPDIHGDPWPDDRIYRDESAWDDLF
jgi:hypothetical protein